MGRARRVGLKKPNVSPYPTRRDRPSKHKQIETQDESLSESEDGIVVSDRDESPEPLRSITAPLKKASFLDLPHAIRRKIYRNLLVTTRSAASMTENHSGPQGLSPTILQTCQEIHEETMFTLYRSNWFWWNRINLENRNAARVAGVKKPSIPNTTPSSNRTSIWTAFSVHSPLLRRCVSCYKKTGSQYRL